MMASPATAKPEDIYAADMMNQLNSGTSFNPVVFGDYPQVRSPVRRPTVRVGSRN